MHHRAKLTDEQVRKMRKEHLAYIIGYETLAKKFNCGISTARDICTYRTRKNVIDSANNNCYTVTMKKSEIIKLLGDAPTIAKRLEYAHRNVVYGWPDELSERQSADVIRRMKAKRIPVPKGWV